jgi:hypothetical protein
MGEIINSYKIFFGKPVDKRPLGRTGSRWKDNIKMDLMKKGLDGVD